MQGPARFVGRLLMNDPASGLSRETAFSTCSKARPGGRLAEHLQQLLSLIACSFCVQEHGIAFKNPDTQGNSASGAAIL